MVSFYYSRKFPPVQGREGGIWGHPHLALEGKKCGTVKAEMPTARRRAGRERSLPMGIRLGLCQTRVTRDKGENLRLAEAAPSTGGRPGGQPGPAAGDVQLPLRKPLLPPLRGARRGGDLAVPGRHGPGAGAVPGRGALCRSWRGTRCTTPATSSPPRGGAGPPPEGPPLRHRRAGGQRFKESDTLAAGNQITVVDTLWARWALPSALTFASPNSSGSWGTGGPSSSWCPPPST